VNSEKKRNGQKKGREEQAWSVEGMGGVGVVRRRDGKRGW
tara:strand:- start:199 stop:318 length:120 start_codon:yes stop_codon:yes gene_type:complete